MLIPICYSHLKSTRRVARFRYSLRLRTRATRINLELCGPRRLLERTRGRILYSLLVCTRFRMSFATREWCQQNPPANDHGTVQGRLEPMELWPESFMVIGDGPTLYHGLEVGVDISSFELVAPTTTTRSHSLFAHLGNSNLVPKGSNRFGAVPL